MAGLCNRICTLLPLLVGNSRHTLVITPATIETDDIQFAKNALMRSGQRWEISCRRLIFQGFFGASGGK
jgi:hypothetical protein